MSGDLIFAAGMVWGALTLVTCYALGALIERKRK